MKLCPKCKKEYISWLQLFCKKCNYQVGEEYITTVGKWRWNAPTIIPEQEEMILDKINWKKESDITACEHCYQNSKRVQLVLPSQDEELKKGKKESDNKLSYELDRYFIEAMAKRMEQHKGKYPPYNRQKPMDVQKLKEALNRHNVEIQKGNYDDEDKYDHLSAIACNAMFIYYQLKNHV